MTANTTCNPSRAIKSQTTKNRLLFDALTPDTRYLIRIYAPTIKPDINFCVRTLTSESTAENDNDDQGLSTWKIVIIVVCGLFGILFLFGLLYYTVQQIKQLQLRRSSMTIKVLSDDPMMEIEEADREIYDNKIFFTKSYQISTELRRAEKPLELNTNNFKNKNQITNVINFENDNSTIQESSKPTQSSSYITLISPKY